MGKDASVRQGRKFPGFGAAAALLAILASAGQVPSSSNPSPAGRPLVLLAADAFSATVELILPEYSIGTTDSPRGIEREISVPGWSWGTAPGLPKLPRTGTLIQVPADAACRVTVLEAESASLYGHPNPAVPRLEREDDGRMTAVDARDTAVFGRNAPYPGVLAELEGAVILRGLPVARLLFHPFQWNPVTRELRVYKRIRVRVEFDRPLPAPSGDPVRRGDDVAELGGAAIINRAGNARPAAAALIRPRRAQAWTNGIRITTASRGIFRLSYEDLVAAGMPRSQSPSGLKMLHRGREVAFNVRPAGAASLGAGHWVEFYAEPVESDETRFNAYWLTWEDGGGPRMTDRAAGPSGGETTKVFRDKIDLEVNSGIWYQTPGAPKADYWFWMRLTAPQEYFVPLALAEDALTDAHEMTIRTAFQGRSAAGHRTSIALNGETWSDERWDGARVFIQTARAPQSKAKVGANVLRIKAPGVAGTVDVSYLNWIEARYWRSLTARGDAIEFDCEDLGARTVEVGGFTSPDVVVFDVSDPASPLQLTGFDVSFRDGKYAVRFGDVLAAKKRYFLATTARLGQAERIEGWKAGGLLDPSRQADMIVIAPRELERAAAALAAFRLTRRVRATVVSVEDIYNEFNGGIAEAAAVKAFLAHAYRGWRRPAPAYVALIGDTTNDPKGYLASGRAAQIPAYWEWTDDLGLTPSDNSLVCVDGDDFIPDMLIGRIPGGLLAEASGTIDKLLATEARRQAPVRRVLLVADNDDPDFETINNQVLDFLPQDYSSIKVYLRAYGNASQATADILEAINGGVDLVSYVGHGTATDWAAEQIFGTSKIALLSNAAHLPVFFTFNCLNGYFSGLSQDCLAEAVIGAADQGGYASYSPSGLGYPWEHSILLKEVMSLLFRGGLDTLGRLMTQAKIAAYALGVSEDILKMYTLFGDPAMGAFVK